MLYQNLCPTCGAELQKVNDTQYACEYCGNTYATEKIENYAEKLSKILDKAKLEMVSNARKNLYAAVSAKYISKTEVIKWCDEVKKYLPDDFQANFYHNFINKPKREVAQSIRKIDVQEQFELLELLIVFVAKSLEKSYVAALKDLIERAYKLYKSDIKKYIKYTTMVENEAEKLDQCMYVTKQPRKAFVAYSSKDSDKAIELVEVLESQGISCFISLRNLRHGVGSQENYDKALKEAMNKCTSFIFVSSMNSRNPECDAFEIEIPYITECDKNNAPGQYRNFYTKIPKEYKKPRVEYRIEESTEENFADILVDEFFDGYERAYTIKDVALRIMRQTREMSAPDTSAQVSQQVDIAKLVEEQVKAQREAEKRREEEEKRKAEEEKIRAKIEEERKKAEAIRRQQEEEERKKEEAERLKREEEERKRKAEEERKRKEEEERKRKQAEERRKAEELKRKQEEEAKRESSAGLKFELNEDGKSYILTKVGSCTEEHIVIDMHKGLPVTSIGEDAFRDCYNLKSITIPNSVTSIGKSVFWGCPNLTSITIPNSVTSIGEYAFCFCFNLTSITMPNSVTSIGKEAFSYCENLTSITIPNSVTNIGEYAFLRCTNLTSITIPNSVTSIGDSAFFSCPKLTNISVDVNNTTYKSINGNFYTKDEKTLVRYAAGKTDKSFTIPNSVTSIGACAFSDCSNLKSITIPNSVTSIGNNAFSGCSNLTSITLSNSVTSIGYYAFSYCSNLTSITIPNSVTSIGNSAFLGCKNLTSIAIPNSVTSIGDSAFKSCENLTSIYCFDNWDNIVGIENAYIPEKAKILHYSEKKPLLKLFKRHWHYVDGVPTEW